MGSATQISDVAAAPVAKVSLGSLLMVGVVTAVLAVGACVGALMYLGRHGKLGNVSAAPEASPVKTEKAADVPTRNVVLEPIVVNLADEEGRSYLRLGVTVTEQVEKDAKAEEKPAAGSDAALRDAVLSVLGRKRSAELLAPGGQQALKEELKKSIEAQVSKSKVQSIYFTEFLVQR